MECGLIIDGKSLNFALNKNLEDSFLDLAINCASVICCRSSPRQKALVSIWSCCYCKLHTVWLNCIRIISQTYIRKMQVTRLVKLKLGKTTLSVGDGANDVSMLQEADIGVGIRGVEGAQVCLSTIPSMC